MRIYLYLKSRKHYVLIPQIRLTSSKNGTTGTAVFEVNLEKLNCEKNILDPIYGIGLENKNTLRMADICHFVWSSGKPIKIIAIFIFSTLEEKQSFFNYYEYYALHKSLEFFPAINQEKTLIKETY